jgi:hypothetical protein
MAWGLALQELSQKAELMSVVVDELDLGVGKARRLGVTEMWAY